MLYQKSRCSILTLRIPCLFCGSKSRKAALRRSSGDGSRSSRIRASRPDLGLLCSVREGEGEWAGERPENASTEWTPPTPFHLQGPFTPSQPRPSRAYRAVRLGQTHSTGHGDECSGRSCTVQLWPIIFKLRRMGWLSRLPISSPPSPSTIPTIPRRRS